MAVDPRLDTLRVDARFQGILRHFYTRSDSGSEQEEE
jgi:hypothetical protein